MRLPVKNCVSYQAIAFVAICLPAAGYAEVRSFHVPAQSASSGVRQFARQAGIQIIAGGKETSGRNTDAVQGKLEVRAALDRLLSKSGLVVHSFDGNFAVLRAAPVAENDEGGEEVVVTASAERNSRSISDKRAALGVVDTISQDDTGDLADDTIAAALVRLPGLDTEQQTFGVEKATYITARGLAPELNSVSLDGMAIFTPMEDGTLSRRVDLALIPTQAIQKVQVYKSFTPDLEGGAIGGVVNLVPYSALDGQDHFTLDVTGNYTPSSHRVSRANSLGRDIDTVFGGGIKGLYTHRFGSRQQFGLVASGFYNQSSFTDTKTSFTGASYLNAAGKAAKTDLSDWNGNDPMPTLIQPKPFTKTLRLFGGYIGLDYQATDSLRGSLSAYDYRKVEYQTTNDFIVQKIATPLYNGQHVATLKIGDIQPTYQNYLFKAEERGAIFKAAKDFGGATSLEVRGGYNYGTYNVKLSSVTADYVPPADYVTIDTSDFSRPSFNFSNTADMTKVSNYNISAALDQDLKLVDEAFEGKIDFKANYGAESQGFGFSTGFDIRNVDASSRDTEVDYVIPAKTALGSLGIVNSAYTYLFPAPSVWIDYRQFAQTLKPGLAVNNALSQNNSTAGSFDYSETVTAGYVAGMYARGGFRGIAGVRYDKVDFDARVPQSSGGSFDGTLVHYHGNYDHLLPYVTLTQALPGEYRLRAAFSKTLGRPEFSDIAAAQQISIGSGENTLTRGNPALKPRQSRNFDVSADHFFNGSQGMISIAGFYKRIKNDIFNLTTADGAVVNGITYDVVQPENASHSQVKGLEASFIDNRLDFLPGAVGRHLGVSANVTRMWGAMDIIVSGAPSSRNHTLYQPNWMANGSVFYSFSHGGEFRIAYNWRDQMVIAVGAQPYRDTVRLGYGTLNAGFRYELKPNLLLKLEADNLTKASSNAALTGYNAPRRVTQPRRVFMVDLIFKR